MSLIRRDGPFPPGGWKFVDPRTGMKFDGMSVTFREQAKKIISHRLANPNVYLPKELQYTTLANVEDELDAYTCSRLGNNSRYCISAGPRIPTPIPLPKVCPKCNTAMEPILCKTCGGRRIKGYHCPKCGAEIKR